MSGRIVVVIPTYNEKGNLPVLAEKIFGLNIPGLSLLVVDDNSPDGTAACAEELAKRFPIRILRRTRKEGIGKAYIQAFQTLLTDPSPPDRIIQMDADMSHDPARIPAMLHAADTYDVIVGSRYIAGGTIENWDFIRRCISRIGNAYARALLRLPYRDLTTGYRCFRREALAQLNVASFGSSGYCFMIEVVFAAHKSGLRIYELPIVFTERTVGKSKFNLGIIMESVWRVTLLAFSSATVRQAREKGERL